MKERPILMSGPLVVKTMQGLKTQTRRALRLPAWFLKEYTTFGAAEIQAEVECPYGRPKELLWVRETWNMRGLAFGMKPRDGARMAAKSAFYYRADDNGKWRPEWGGWRPAIHMPREASRLTLEITAVRAERLQDMDEDAPYAEGIPNDPRGFGASARADFSRLWDSINGKRLVGGRPVTWKADPWVWLITYKVASLYGKAQ